MASTAAWASLTSECRSQFLLQAWMLLPMTWAAAASSGPSTLCPLLLSSTKMCLTNEGGVLLGKLGSIPLSMLWK